MSQESQPIHFVTGSTSDIPVAWAQEHNVGIVPAVIRFGEEVFTDNADFTMVAFLKKLKESRDFPKTAAPNPEIYKPFYDYQGPIISIHAGSGLSSFWDNCEATRRELNRDNIYPYNSWSVSLGEGFLVMRAVELEAQGAREPEIIKALDEMRPRTHVIALCDTLAYLKAGGRVSNSKAFFGQLLDVKPSVYAYNNMIVPLDTVRTHKKSIAQLATRVREFGKLERLAVLHTGNLDYAKELAETLKDEFESEKLLITLVTKAVAANAGPNALGVALVQER